MGRQGQPSTQLQGGSDTAIRLATMYWLGRMRVTVGDEARMNGQVHALLYVSTMATALLCEGTQPGKMHHALEQHQHISTKQLTAHIPTN